VIFGLPGRERVLGLEAVTNDLLRKIWMSLGLNPDDFTDRHKGWGLDVVCRGTFGRGKTGNGGDAPKWFQAGQWPRLVDYCIDDVKLERNLTNFVDKYGFVINGETGRVLRMR
jgi:hypothetical protein